jgi:hypothetical protein
MIMIVPITPGASGVAELDAVPILYFCSCIYPGNCRARMESDNIHKNLLIGGIISLKVIKDMALIKKLMGSSTELQQIL